jgi:hypothetical protein
MVSFCRPCSAVLCALDWHAPQRLPAVVLLLAALIICVCLFYRRPRSHLEGAWLWLLGALRTAALASLALALLQPVILRPPSAKEAGALVVLIDRSRSMGVRDAQRTPAQWVALADGLGRLPAGLRTGAADALIGDVAAAKRLLDDLVQAQADFDFLVLSARDAQAAAARRAQAQARFLAAAHHLCDQRSAAKVRNTRLADRLTELLRAIERIEQPRKAPSANDAASLDALHQQLDNVDNASIALQNEADQELYAKNAQVRGICDELAGLNRLALVEQALWRPQTGLLSRLDPKTPVLAFSFAQTLTPWPPPFDQARGGPPSAPEADGQATHLAEALRDAMAQLKGQPVLALLLFSDGRETPSSPRDPLRAIPPFEPPLADALDHAALFTIATAPPQPPRYVSLAPISAPPSVWTGENFSINVALRGSRSVVSPLELRCTIDGIGRTRALTLDNDAEAHATFDAQFTTPGVHSVVAELLNLPANVAMGNNRLEARIKAFSQPCRILALAGSAARDFGDLCADLGQAPWATLQQSVLEGDTARLQISPEEISRHDIFILCDLPPAALNAAQWHALQQRIVAGAGAILIAGFNQPPDPSLAQTPEFLPFSIPGQWRIWKGNQAVFRFLPAEDAVAQKLLRLADDPAASREKWESLEPLYRYWQLAAPKPPWHTLLAESQSGDPVLLDRTLGMGRVYFVGLDQTWRWQSGRGAGPQEQFWNQLAQSLATLPYLLNQTPLALDIDPVQARPQQSISVRAAWTDSSAAPARLQLDVLQNEKLLQTHWLDLDAGRQGTAALPGLDAGDYELCLHAPQQLSPDLRCPLQVAADYSVEMADLSGDREALKRLATLGGGAALDVENLQSLPARLQAVARQRGDIQEPLWNSGYLFLFVIACLCAEWGLRKGVGLA